MQYALPHSPNQMIAATLAALALGAGAGITGAILLNDDEVVFQSPAAESAEPRVLPAPVPERVQPAPSVGSSAQSRSVTPAPERVSPAPPQTGSLAGTTGTDTPPPVPERISGAHLK